VLDRLNLQRYAAVKQRIDIHCVLPRLDKSETGLYIQAHLAYAQELYQKEITDPC